jgi:SAM-dependent methyltransferase
MRLAPHSEEWYAWLAKKQSGYFYPGRRVVAPWHGEDNFLALVMEHLRPDLDVLEVGCAQGNLSLAMAPHVRSVLAYDATPDYIDLACRAAEERGIGNVTFIVYNARARFNEGQVRLPAVDHSIDLVVNSKGPWHTILDVPRVCRPGAVMLILAAAGGAPAGSLPPPWNDLLPEPLRMPVPPDHEPAWVYKSITANLAEAGLKLHSWWDFDVPEYIPDPEALYTWLSWPFVEDEIPSYPEAAPALEHIFREFAGPQGLENRWRRSICKVVVPG